MSKKKVDDIEDIGNNLPKSKATQDFIKKVQAKSETQKQKSKDKAKKAKSATKEPTALTDLPGVGGKLAKRISDHGFKTVEEIAELEADDLTDIKGIGSPKKADELIEAARKMTGWKKAKAEPKPEPEPAKPKKAPPLKVRVNIPKGETLYFMPSEIDNTQHQPRGALEGGELFVPDELIENIRRHKGNFQAILAYRQTISEELSRGIKVITIDGHRRAEAIRRINQLLEPKDQLQIKAEILDVTEAEAAIIALDINLDAEKLTESERDKWIYSLMEVHAMTDDQISETTGLNKTTLSNIRRVFEKAPKQVTDLLDKGEITTGHIKAVVSLPERDQKRIMKKAAKRDLSVREVEGEAKQARNKEGVVQMLRDHLFTKYQAQIDKNEELEVPSLAKFYTDVTNAVFPNGAQASMTKFGHWVSDSDVKSALRRVGLKVVEKAEPMAPEPPKSLCESCVAHIVRGNKCMWSAIVPECKPPMFDTCPKYLAGKAYSDWELNVCPHCHYPVWTERGEPSHIHVVEGAVTVSASENSQFLDSAVKGDITMKAHTFCLFQHLAKQLNITGLCEDCNNKECEFMQGISKMSDVVKGSFNVAKCKIQIKGFDLTALNKATVEAWADAMKAQEPDPDKEDEPEIVAETVENPKE